MEEKIKEILLDSLKSIDPIELLNNISLKYWMDNWVNPCAEKILDLLKDEDL